MARNNRTLGQVTAVRHQATTYDLLAAEQVAERLGVSPRQVTRLAVEGEISYLETPLGRVYARSEAGRVARGRQETAACQSR